MTPEQFAYWLNGFAELNGAPPTCEQWKSIQDHLKTVFFKVTPPLGVVSPAIDPFKYYKTPLQDHQTRVTC